MKRILMAALMAATVCVSATTSLAQDAPPQQRDGRRPMARLMQGGGIERQLEELNLTEEQKKQIEPILEGLRQQMRDAMQEANQKVDAVLTEEQRTKLRELRDRAPGGPGGPGAQFDPVQRMENAVQGLDLTAEQKTKLAEVFTKFRAEFKAMREQPAGDRQAMMQSMRPLLQDLRSQVTAILTPEQTAKLQEQMGGGPGAGGWRDPMGGKDRPNAAREGKEGRRKDAAKH